LKVFESQQNDSKEQQLKLVEIEKSSAVLQSQCEQQEKENTKLSAELQESITEIKTLKGMGRFAHLARFFIG
jgi:cell division protein FtsB